MSDPYNSTRVAEARLPGPDNTNSVNQAEPARHLRLLLLSVRRGGRLKAGLIAQADAGFIICTELQLLDSAVADF